VDVLSAPWLTSLGKYSYAIYVFHLPIHLLLHPRVQARLSSGSDAARLAAHAGYTLFVLVLSLLLAMLTWRVIEQPFLSLKRYFPMPAAAPRGRRAPDLVGQAQARLEL
jgi:peptidoglycan/LPS O-acetylase OafA/YrhL